MKININNYESYFLLYIDNELSVEESKLVEEFVAQNPALKEEFELLQDTVLPLNEEIKFDKDTLYKTYSTQDPLQELMLLHLDNELEPAAAAELVNKIGAADSLQTQWSVLQKTKLEAGETIPFPGKNILYKKERSKVVSLSFVRWAVAAAVIAGGLFWGIRLTNEMPAGSNETAINNTGTIIKPGIQNKPAEETLPVKKEIQPGNETATIVKGAIKTDDDLPVNKMGKNNLARVNNKQDKKIQTAGPDQDNGITQPVLAKVDTREERSISKLDGGMLNIKKTSTDKADLLAAMTAKEKPKNFPGNDGQEIIQLTNSYASVASLQETPNDDHIFLMDQEKLADSKAGIFLKKLKRTVSRTTNISPGKTLKIAGFEFAVK